jgi:hypothetical protein
LNSQFLQELLLHFSFSREIKNQNVLPLEEKENKLWKKKKPLTFQKKIKNAKEI